MFLEGETVIINELARKGIPNRVGEVVIIEQSLYDSFNFDYKVRFDDGDSTNVKESELSKLTEVQKQQVEYIKRHNKVIYTPTNEEVKIETVDYIHGQVEIRFNDNGVIVTGFESLRKLDKESVNVTELDTYTHEDLVEVFFGHYKNEDNTFTVPKEFLLNLLKQFV